MRIDLRPVADLSIHEQQELDELEARCFGAPVRRELRLVPAPASDTTHVVRIWEGDGLVSCLWLTERNIINDGRRAFVAGIRGVRTDPAHRRRGFGSAAMRHAADFIWRDLRPDFALLLSSEMAVPFYRSLGWQTVNGAVFCQQPGGRINLTETVPNNPVMVLMSANRHVPRGTIDLCGLPW